MSMKNTKIVATLGPASSTEEVLTQMIENGVNAFRLNFSHGSHEEHLERLELVRSVAHKLGVEVAIIQDLQGAKVRLGEIDGKIILQKDQEITLYLEGTDKPSGEQVYPAQYDFFPELKVGHRIYINDGLVLLSVVEVNGKSARCVVKTSGPISTKKGFNLPDTYIANAAFTEKDANDLQFGLAHHVDYVAISFIQTADDLKKVREHFTPECQPKLITKFETQQAIYHMEEIVHETDVIMVARGDLGIEAGQEEIPLVQRKLIALSRKHSTPVIVATQMLESMVTNAQPTRAEVNDVATAVLDQADAVMLSAESAVGFNPPLVVETMARIASRVEVDQKEQEEYHETMEIVHSNAFELTAPLAQAAAHLAHEVDAKAILSITSSGKTATSLASYRPHVPTFVACDNADVAHQLALVYGIYPTYVPKITDNQVVFDEILANLETKGYVKSGDTIVVLEGSLPGIQGGTDTIKVIKIK